MTAVLHYFRIFIDNHQGCELSRHKDSPLFRGKIVRRTRKRSHCGICRISLTLLLILGDPGVVSRVWRKSARNVFKNGRKIPWVPTLTGPFPNSQANAGSWLGTKNDLCTTGEQHRMSSFWLGKTFACYQQNHSNLHREDFVFDRSQGFVNIMEI